MTSIVFETPGEIDLRAFTTFGLHAKPNSENPIGHFGTGLKYSVAVLVRNGNNVTVYTNGKEYVFYKGSGKFRDTTFESIKMKQRSWRGKWQYTTLPFTTDFGKNWEMWMALRELESNTRDEGGVSWIEDDVDQLDIAKDKTYIIVSDPDFVECYGQLNTIFLRDGLPLVHQNCDFEVYKRPSKYVYYRGLRVMELEKTSMYTYNYTSQQTLTEDRTLKWGVLLNGELTSMWMECDKSELLGEICKLQSDSDFYEADLEFDTCTADPSQEFLDTIQELDRSKLGLSSRLGTYHSRYYSDEPTVPDELGVELSVEDWNTFKDLIDEAQEAGFMVDPLVDRIFDQLDI